MAEMKIYCPICGRKVGKWDGKTKTLVDVECRKCNKLVIFYPISGQTMTKALPKPNSASGKRIY